MQEKTLKETILETKLTDEQVAIFYLGQESILLKTRGKYLLFDAYLSDYVDRNCSSDGVRWVRRYAPPIGGEELDLVDIVFCSHEHADHTDPYTLSAIAAVNPRARFIAPAPFADTLKDFGVSGDNIIKAYADVPITVDGICITPVPAAHEELSPNADGLFECLGYAVDLENSVIFHAGDCCVYPGLCERLGGVDVMLLPVNGRSYFGRYERNIIGNMNACEAAELCVKVSARLLLPMHFDLYDVNCVEPSVIVGQIESVSRTLPYHIPRPGERYIFSR